MTDHVQIERRGPIQILRLNRPDKKNALSPAMYAALADALTARKNELYELSYNTGATKADSWIDIDGGIGTFAVYQGKGRRELPNERILIDGNVEALSRNGTFQGLHVFTSLRGVAVHINAFNFPVWGMLEKLAPTFLAGLPAIVKPASATSYLTEAAVRIMLDANVLPPGALQLIVGSTGDLFDHLTSQDVVSFTGSAQTAGKLKSHPVIQRESVRFVAEQDSLNASVLGPDATPESPEFDLFIKEVAREMTVKAGQKCTAIRRALVPTSMLDSVQNALISRLGNATIGDPRDETTRLGALAGIPQRADVIANLGKLTAEAEVVFGGEVPELHGNLAKGAFFEPTLLRCENPDAAEAVHSIEAFGPVCTLMPYRDADDAIMLAKKGKGSLALSIFSHDRGVTVDLVKGDNEVRFRSVVHVPGDVVMIHVGTKLVLSLWAEASASAKGVPPSSSGSTSPPRATSTTSPLPLRMALTSSESDSAPIARSRWSSRSAVGWPAAASCLICSARDSERMRRWKCSTAPSQYGEKRVCSPMASRSPAAGRPWAAAPAAPAL